MLALFFAVYKISRASQVALVKRNLPAMQEAWVWSLGWEDSLGEEVVAHSSILSWEVP